jgi:hypothetical protein
MVKKIVLFIVLASTLLFYPIRAQSKDSIKCDEYFHQLGKEKIQLITLWSRAPVLKENNAHVLSELCTLISGDSCESLVAAFILDKNGNPLCVKTYNEIINDSLRNEVIKLLYMIEFEPAIGDKQPVMSHFVLILDAQRCKMYKNMDVRNNRKRKKK